MTKATVAAPASPEEAGAREDNQQQGSKRALLYLRVSTKEQAMRSGDPEGYSLPTQREACLRKAQSLGAIVVEEYLDKDTGTLVDKRSEMQRLLARVEKDRDIDFVIVHKLDRLARNRLDDAMMTLTLETAGAVLVSCVEGIDQTPSGGLLHGILASVNEYYSRNLSDEVKRKTVAKAKNGGTPNRAPLGYLNKQNLSGGRDDRWVEVDPERAPLVTWAFEAYATGDWSEHALLDELTERGLRTRPTARQPSKELSLSMVSRMLNNPYYMGVVTWCGVQYDGSHRRLVSPELFYKVQDVLQAHNLAGERSWRHHQYLKGTLFCDKCGGRLTFTYAHGNGGQYTYFVCMGQKRGTCTQRHLNVDMMIDFMEQRWANVRVTEDAKVGIRRVLDEDLAEERQEVESERRMKQRAIQRLKDERQKLLDGYYAGAIPVDLMKSEQERIGRGLAEAEARLAGLAVKFEDLEATITKAMAWADHLHAAYQAADDQVRRLFNQAVFEQVFIGPNGVSRVKFTEGFEYLMGQRESGVEQIAGASESTESVAPGEGPNDKRPGRSARAYYRNPLGHGWNVKRLVGCSGNSLTRSKAPPGTEEPQVKGGSLHNACPDCRPVVG